MMPGVNNVIYGCFSARTTPEVIAMQELKTLEEKVGLYINTLLYLSFLASFQL